MGIKQEKRGDVLVLALEGELMGGEDAKVFQNRIFKAIQESNLSVVVDMREVSWMNASGLGMLMDGLTNLKSNSGDLKLANVSKRIQHPIEVTKLDKVLLMYGSVDEAVEAFKDKEVKNEH